ncbi:MAG: DNA mismatch repair protein MutS [Eubacteriales bacterium]|nr:DNA mismatch repair protein MutS [Eubacteriales bacterium]
MPLSPMMQQYFEIKKQHPDCILMFRLGDFYEMFFDDAKLASRELELVLTGRDCGTEERAPMCGVPYHALEGYLSKLITKGYRVAICEQMEDPATAKGIVKRAVVRVVSPGTVIESPCLDESKNNYICSLYYDGFGYGVVFADISTGELHATELESEEAEEVLYSEAAAFAPSELVINKAVPEEIKAHFNRKYGTMVTPADESRLEPEKIMQDNEKRFGEGTVNPSSKAAYALSMLMFFLEETQKTDLSYMKSLTFYKTDKYLSIDTSSRRNLELCESMRTREKKGTLLWVLDKTKTSAGARLLRRWTEKPLVNVKEIQSRQNAVKELYGAPVKRNEIGEALKKVVDIERLLTRLIYGTANARDLLALGQTISALPDIKDNLKDFNSPLVVSLYRDFDLLPDIGESILSTIIDDPPLTLREGGIIRPGASAAVDELRSMMTDGKTFISKIEQTEKERTGIRTLKVGYNKIFGYYIEVSKSFMNQVPDTYIRRQTLANCERYVTEELKEMESRVISSRERDANLEYELFTQLREHILKSKDRIRRAADTVSHIDALFSLAVVADESNYVCPEVDYSDTVFIKDGRHPVVEKFMKDKYFVPNDCDMDCQNRRTMIITGPNMAGKSTYMRQVALIVLMAQAGSFVPASEARIGVVDKIFTRVGASDDLSSGDSTFMLEMKEVAHILKNATAKSLIIYDEIGRGTSTFDGMSIARAVLEYTNRKIGAKTLFATHYHELTSLEDSIPGIVNYNIAAKKRGSDIIFLRKIVKGGTDDSYGIEVAQLAGVPKEVVTKARSILKQLETAVPSKEKTHTDDGNMTIEDMAGAQIADRLKAIDINTLTPIEAMGILYEMKIMLK